MEVHNNFSPLAFRKKESKATYEKWYAFGKNYAIPASANTLTPFQFTELNIPVFNPNTIEVEVINEETGESKKSGVYVSFDVMPEHGGVLYVSPGKNSFREALPQGTYRARFSIGGEVYISTPFCVIPGIETSSKYLLIEYWNDEKIAYPGGFITTGANNDFRYQMYVPATICKPKYEFEEELTKRAGYKFLELQTSTKVYAFTFVAPEFICDAMRLIRLSDYIRISHDGEYYNALNFEFDVDWQEQLYLAAVDCQFETDSIIQKLPSFNRRDKASFYNALLANIDTPIMFSPDTVGLYYKEYRETEPVVKGKLIRELSPIDLIDENTTIAVDLGTGEARKFNLYRMLQDYISKTHEDATDFLLHLRGGATFGEGITGSAASINAVGDAEVQGLNARVTKVKSLDSEDYVTVNKTAFTVNKQGDTALNALNARGDSHLQQDVYTGNNTGKITKEGQLQYLSAIIQQFLSSPTFVSGFLGEGFKIWVENGNWHIECDNLTVRQTMNIFELLIQKIRSVNGALVVSQSNGKIKSVSEDETNYVITMEEEGETFQPNDLVRCQVWTGSKTKFYWVEVSSVSGNSITVKKSEFTAGNKPEKGDEVVQMGNTQNAQRQALIYITAQESGHPYIEILNGVKTKSLSGTNRTRLGDLSNIQDSAFPEGQQPSGSGLYCDNAFLRGIFLLRNGKSVEDEVNQAKQDAANAATEAERAQQTAQEAKDRLNKWADDGFISPTEKPALIDEGKRIQAEFLQIKNNADKYGVSVTEYTKAYEDYLNELRYHSAQQPEDIAVRPELAKTQTIYYDRRNGALNAIANAAKSYVDNADKKLKEYLDTEITAIPGKIELAVRSLKTANYNLLLDSNHTLSENPYQLGAYKYDVHLVKGKSYTLTVCYKCADSDNIKAYNNPSFGYLAILPKSAEETIVSTKITPSNDDAAYFYFYKNPQQQTTQTYVKWAVITEGDIGVSNWIPSKSEMFSGGSNLVLNSGVCVDNYALFFLSKTYYELRGQDVVISFDYEYSNLVLGGNNRFGVETDVPLSTGGVQYFGAFVYVDYRSPSNGKGRYSYALKVSDNVVDNGLKYIQAHVQVGSGTVVKICNFQIEKGNTPTEWKPAPEDILNDSKKYTDTQILAVDGKIELSVKTKVENLGIGANNLYSYTSSPLNVLYPSPIIERKMSLHGFYLVGSEGKGGAMRIPNIIPPIPGKYTVSGWIKGSQNTPVGFTIDVCDSESYTVKSTADNQWSYFKHTFNVTKNTEEQKDVYNFVDIERIDWAYIWVKDFKVEAGEIATAWSPNFQDAVYKGAEYTNSQISVVEGKITSTVEKIEAVDGKVTGLASRVTQTESSINSVVERVDNQGNRLNAAEIKLESTSVKLGVVEGTANGAQSTANAANSLAGTANNKAEAADGRVTATQNGLVETGINITSRKIVLKSDNVLFQNNAGQQTAAINANGKLTANAIEVGEVVAGGFAAQRITTGNLTVTDGAVIAGMTISNNRLTGGNVTLTSGARIGSFQVSLNWLTGLNSAQMDLWAGANTGEGNNTLIQPGRIMINQKGDNDTALEIRGKGNTLIAGKYCSLNVDTFQVTANQVRIPGVFYACVILSNGAIGSTWGSFNFHITRVGKNGTGRYIVEYSGYKGNVLPMVVPYDPSKWTSAVVELAGGNNFQYKMWDTSRVLVDCGAIIYFCGMPS